MDGSQYEPRLCLAERRADARCATAHLRCSRGRILDFSASGMRLLTRRRWRSGKRKIIRIKGPNGLSLTVPACCVWSKRLGLGSFIVGIAFDHASDDELHGLRQLVATFGIDEHRGTRFGTEPTERRRAA